MATIERRSSMKWSNSDFVHFHCHSEFSQFDGLAQLENLVMTSREMGFPGLAITDHGNIGSWIKFIQYAKASKDKNGKSIDHPPLKPILGCEFYLSEDHSADSNKQQIDGRKGNRHLTLFAKNFKGYQNLCALSQSAFTDGFFHDPRIDIMQLAEHSEGMLCGSACLSSVINANLYNDRYDAAKRVCTIFKDIFKEDFFLEAMYHGIPAEGSIIPDIFKLSSDLDIPVIATNDAHYIKKEHGRSQELLMAMSTSRCMNDPKRLRFPYDEFYLKSAEEMGKIWGDSPQTLTNSIAMLERIDNEDIEQNLFGGMRLPAFEVPEDFDTPYDYLKHLAKDGLKKLGWHKSKDHIETLKMELNDVKVAYENNNYDFATYFLIVWDYVNFARKQGILTGCGRGSGYASVLLRCLGITYGPDPLKFGLLWQRFLAFDEIKYIKADDFGFEDSKVLAGAEDLEDDREVEEDPGGVDRY